MQEPWQTLLNQSKTWELIVEDASNLQRKPILKNSVSTPWQCCQFWFCKCHFFVPPKPVRKKAYEKIDPGMNHEKTTSSTPRIHPPSLVSNSQICLKKSPNFMSIGLIPQWPDVCQFFCLFKWCWCNRGVPLPFLHLSKFRIVLTNTWNWNCFFLETSNATIVGSVPKTQCTSWCSGEHSIPKFNLSSKSRVLIYTALIFGGRVCQCESG